MKFGSQLSLDELKRQLGDTVNAMAEAKRKEYTSQHAGQQATYAAKLQEATAIIDGTAGETPYLSAEAAVDNLSLEDKARQVIAAATKPTPELVQIELKRLAVKAAINAATDYASARAAANVIW